MSIVLELSQTEIKTILNALNDYGRDAKKRGNTFTWTECELTYKRIIEQVRR